MKKYIQITAGRGPVECARVATLVARELLKAIPSLHMTDSEPHNRVEGCYMSVTLATDEDIPLSTISEWEGTVETAVRAIHIPTGLSVKCSDERSQSQNKVLARERLLLKLRQRNDKTVAESQSRQWCNHDNLERGNPVKKYSGPL